MPVARFIKTTLQDWEGKNACMILLQGCNLRCPFCNHPELIDATNEKGIDIPSILKYIKENRDFLDAVVISGGEPTSSPELYPLLKDIKTLKLKIKVDTNGTRPDILDDLIGAKLIDKVCMNILAPLNDSDYSKAAGITVDTALIRKSIEVLSRSDIKFEFRVTAVPDLIGHEAFLQISKTLVGQNSLIIQQFDPKMTLNPEYRKMRPYPTPVLVRMAETAKQYIKHVRVRGI